MEKFLYFRAGTAAAEERDDDTGSLLYPASHLIGMCSGTAAADGTVTDDDNAISVFLKPIKLIAGAEADSLENADIITLATAQYGQKDVMKQLVAAINQGPHSTGFITVADNGVGGTGSFIEGVTACAVVVINEPAD
tara:strand:+ start:403 stop:813 length:411 start_codon:yes stop_codon:yes gene_type:complete